mmetsp:Transcript_41153/g.44657  ORF Transcript_41153/g.44657 Transcript_41153/m.44657 type:complete len:96 (+) Transcript_41153:254-541(+)
MIILSFFYQRYFISEKVFSIIFSPDPHLLNTTKMDATAVVPCLLGLHYNICVVMSTLATKSKLDFGQYYSFEPSSFVTVVLLEANDLVQYACFLV